MKGQIQRREDESTICGVVVELILVISPIPFVVWLELLVIYCRFYLLLLQLDLCNRIFWFLDLKCGDLDHLHLTLNPWGKGLHLS
jgi:hypothetical protein